MSDQIQYVLDRKRLVGKGEYIRPLTDKEEYFAQLEEAWRMDMNGEVKVLAGSEERVQELLEDEE